MAAIVAVDLAANASVKMEEAAPAVMGGDGQWPAVLGLGWWPVAAMAAEMAATPAASTRAELVPAMVVAAAAAVAARRRRQDEATDISPFSLRHAESLRRAGF